MIGLSIAWLLAATPTPAPAPVQPTAAAIDCRDTAHRAFDFWVGAWQVSDTRSGQAVAESDIALLAGGCTVQESFRQSVGPGGRPSNYRGHSLSALGADGVWRQFYVDTSGASTSWEGAAEAGSLVFTTRGPQALQRMTYRALADGAVRQIGEVSRDNGATWQPGYDFTYRRR